LAVARDRLCGLPLLLECIAQVEVGLDKEGANGKRLLKMPYRIGRPSFLQESNAQVIMSVRMARIAAQGLFVAPDRFRDPSLVFEDKAQIVVRIRMVWADRQRLAITPRCLVQSTLFFEQVSQVVMGHGTRGIKLECPAVTRGRPVQVALVHEDAAEI